MARVTSIYKALKYVVECQPAGQAFFDVIAAFNHDRTAIDYAKDYHKLHQATGGAAADYRYRVTERKNNEPKCIYRSDTAPVSMLAIDDGGLAK